MFGVVYNSSFNFKIKCGARNLRSQPTLYSGPKAQAEEPYCRGRMMKAPQRPKNVAEDNLVLNTSQNAWKKGQIQYKNNTREKAANTVMWSPASYKPILQTLLFNFPQPPQPLWRMDW